MKNITIRIITALVLVGFILPVFANFEEEKDIIDGHTPSTFSVNINQLYDFTVENLTDDSNDRFKTLPVNLALHQLKLQEFDEVPSSEGVDNYALNIIYGGLHRLNRLRQLTDPTALNILEAAEAAAVLLSPEVFVEDYAYSYDYGLYKAGLTKRTRLYYEGMVQRKDGEEKFLSQVSALLDTPHELRDGYSLVCKYFTPLIMTGESAVFSEEAYLYALSKGIILYGLDSNFNKAHGGLFELPIELFVHDQAHIHDIIMPRPESEVSDAEYESVTRTVTNLVGQILNLVSDETVIAPSEKKKAIRAAFYLFHESRIYQSTPRLHEAIRWSDMPKAFETLIRRLDMTLQAELNVVGPLKPPSTLSHIEKIYADMEAQHTDDIPTDTFNFLERFASDFPLMIVDTYGKDTTVDELSNREGEDIKELTIDQYIYDTEDDLDRTRVFHGQRTLNLTSKLVQWFAGKLKDKIK